VDAWHTLSVAEALAEAHSQEEGLTGNEAIRRLKESGRNALPDAHVDGYGVIFLRQFKSPLIYILLAASGIIFYTGERVDAAIILFVLFFNALVGALQEGKAQNTLLALRRFTKTTATVLREGTERTLSDSEVVPGDVLVLYEGAKIPADARLLLSRNLKTDEASLTGESEPVRKDAESPLSPQTQVAERRNMVWKGTNVVSGAGRALVVATGMQTVIGKVVKEVAAIDTEIPLRANIRSLSRVIIVLVGGLSAVLFGAGILFGNSIQTMFATVVSLAVSVIPEGLPIVMTLVLASGVWRMGKRNALVKKLQAVEALGQARVIAVDKTGTITKNELVIQKVWTNDTLFAIGGIGYDPKGEVSLEGRVVNAANHEELLFAGKIAAFCASARTTFSGEEKKWSVSGDPTEAAMFVFAQKVGFDKDELERESPLLSETPFDYALKYHATIHAAGKKQLHAVVGAPEAVLSLCSKIRRGGADRALGKKEKENLEQIFANLSDEGLRVVAFASATSARGDDSLPHLTFGGFFGMKDGLRPEVALAMERAREAGIRVVMITGDHKLTARAIAREAGIYREGSEIFTGEDIDRMTDAELSARLGAVSVFARVTPEHKLRIIGAYRARGEIVAMTGDGVNDAPSLVAADLGVAMGKIGTEVAKEAADIILLDDNFGSIVSAVEEGRSIYKTIKKVILYLFSTGLGEVLVIVGALLIGFPLPLLAAQIIWLNFVTDGFLDVALAMEPKEEGLLSGRFERPKKYLVDRLMAGRMIVMALPMMLGTLLLFSQYVEGDMTKAWTISLTTLAVFQWFNAWNCRSDRESVFRTNPLSNLYLVGATGIVITLQLFAVYHPLLQGILNTTPLSLNEWLVIVPIASSVLLVEEIRKFFHRRRMVRKEQAALAPAKSAFAPL